jgi:hypothetical protein
MNDENTKYLFENFDFWASRESPMHSAMYWGFQHDDGWFRILTWLCEDLKGLGLNKDNFQVTTVKEKLGKLYFYWHMTSEKKPNFFWRTRIGGWVWSKIWLKTPGRQIRGVCTRLRQLTIGKNLYEKASDLVNGTCSLSIKICEVCGNPGRLCWIGPIEDPWFKTLCEICRKKEGYNVTSSDEGS